MEAMLASAKSKLEEMKNSLSAELEMALYEYRDAERKITLYKDNLLPKAAQSLSSFQQAFAAGKMGFLDVIDAKRTLLEFKLSYEKALTDRSKSIAMIEMLVGKISSANSN
jgi:outer membrane protein, heavy metal efflux system